PYSSRPSPSPPPLSPLSLHDALPISNTTPSAVVAPLGSAQTASGSLEQFLPASVTPIPRLAVKTIAGGVARGICLRELMVAVWVDRKSTRLNSSHGSISYAVFCLKKK